MKMKWASFSHSDWKQQIIKTVNEKMKLKIKIKKKTRWKFNRSEKHWEIDQNSIHAPYERLLFHATFVCSLALTVWHLFSHSLENLPHRHSTGCSNSINRSKRQAIEKKNLSHRIFFCNDVHSHTLRWRERARNWAQQTRFVAYSTSWILIIVSKQLHTGEST